MTRTIRVRNRPIEHYALSIFSLLLKGETDITIRSQGSVNGRTIDFVNLLTETVFPGMFDVECNYASEQTAVGESSYKASVLTVRLRMK